MVTLGRTVPESIEMMKRLVAAGIDAVDVSIGVPESSQYTSAPPDVPQGYNTERSVQFKQALSVPVLVAGRINDPAVAEEIIKSGKADLVHIGRQSLTDPDWPIKVAQGHAKDIVQCLSCNEACIEGLAIWLRPSITCVQNLAVGREAQYAQPKTDKPKNVLIAGAGPGGWRQRVPLHSAATALPSTRKTAIWAGKPSLYPYLHAKPSIQDVARFRDRCCKRALCGYSRWQKVP